MTIKSYIYCFLLFFSCLTIGNAQEFESNILTFNEYLGYVKKYHPIVKQANLEIDKAQAGLMQARGGFDPKIEVDYDEKEFTDKEYYSVLTSSFKIPTWYGIEVKAGFDNSEGIYLNPQNTTPNQGLTSLGITVPLGQGLFINQRMADVRTAKIQLQLSDAERKLKAVNVLYDAAAAYFDWKKSHDETLLYENYLTYARTRYNGVLQLIEQGDKPAIDSVEAGITVKNRRLNLENSKLKLAKAKLKLANYLWINDIPVELEDAIIPEEDLMVTVKETLKTNNLITETTPVDNHPKITSLQNKVAILEVERKLQANMLLPKIDVGYHYLSEPSNFDNYRFNDYKFGVNFAFPIFLRKERGKLNLAKLKIQDTQLELNSERLNLKNKIEAQQTEITSLQKQKNVIDELVESYSTMLTSEERLFSFGESSLFLINTRENRLVSARIEQIDIENRYLLSNAELFKIMANPD
ncbi:TolC family protein [Flavobacterium salilacus subsp. salilacus]|uniref:TolC family protein n=1 Tax=Flavobacterium TaxID=237 RepID=UPI0010753954|nr:MULTISPECIES: TolC family protein [Flavobacterium]KAF2518151.1 TolC family protein [Flavobacterium salilacus subsp. salilacus]MBE1615539.1 TolC family protein [Flavobacterium sp. SaA2.13]